MQNCLNCSSPVHRKVSSYCSNQCQNDYQYTQYIELWLAGRVDGNRGVKTKNISGHVIRYLRETYMQACSICSWDKTHAATGRVPLEIDHIDGNADNSSKDNLRLICPNCHALTSNYRNLNKGKGREWRRLKYNKG